MEQSSFCQPNVSVNGFGHLYQTPDSTFTTVVRPNVDTLYSSAFLDLTEGPVVVEIPPTGGRYVLTALFDAWSNNFAAVSSLSNGGGGGYGDDDDDDNGATFVIASKDWEGELPDTAKRFDSPTPWVWLLIRTEVLGVDDVPKANAIQNAMTVALLEGGTSTPVDVECPVGSPPEAVANMSGVEFFSRLSSLIKEQGALLPGDEPTLRSLASIGVGPFATSSVEDLSFSEKAQLQAGAYLAQQTLDYLSEVWSPEGWSPDPTLPVGDYGTEYLLRAIVARVGFGANRPEFAVYQNTKTDGNNLPLTGEEGSVYTITFAANEQPPVDGFWSITVYNAQLYLTENSIERYALGSNNDLVVDPDGSIVLTLSYESPEADPTRGPMANWLPIPDEPFELTLRMYAPTQAVFTKEWAPPRPQLRA